MSEAQEPNPLAPQGTSPLAEPDPDAINVLIRERLDAVFNRPPREVSDEDLSVMVEYYRRERARFALESLNKPPKGTRNGTTRRRETPTSVADALRSSVDLL
jgi:hypothetical protein